MTPDISAAAETDERIRIESFIADCAARFTAAGSEDSADRDIPQALGELARLLGADRCLLLGGAPGAPAAWITCGGQADQYTAPLEEFNFAQSFPWQYRRLRSGENPVGFAAVAVLPPVATTDRRSAGEMGIRSMLAVSSAGPDSGGHCLAVQCLRRERTWPPYLAGRLALLAQVFVNVLARERLAETRRQVESEHHDLLESVKAIVWRADARTFQTRFVSKETELLLGFPVEAWTRIPGFWVNHIHPDDRPWVLEFTGRAIREHRKHDFEYRMIVADGRTVWLRNIVNVIVEKGVPRELVGVTVDVDERKRAAIEVARLRHQLTQSLRVSSLGELAATLAHELNQPLGALLSNAEAAELKLQESPADPEGLRTILADIAYDAQRAGAILHRVRRVLQRQEMEREPLDLPRLIDDVVKVSRSLALSRHVNLSSHTAPALPRPRGDAVQIQQVLINLILNAIDAVADLPEAMRRVSIKAVPGDSQNVELIVSDTGRGIPADAMLRLFEPFFTTKSGGMGMGLPICRTIVEAHGGEILVENNAEGGVTVRVRLPLADGQEGVRHE